MRVLVTGASGYVGGAVVEALRRVGADAAALARPTSRVDDLRARGVPVRIAAFDDAAALDAALEGVHSVVHCAGGGRVTRRAELATNNASTTSALADAIERSDSVKRLVLVSSVAARGPTTPSAAATPEPLTEYGRAKRLAEVRCASLAASGRSVRIARPPGVYGPGDDRMLPLFRAARRGWVPVPAAAGAASFVFIDDCADALAILAVAPEADGPDAPVVLEVAHAEPIPAAEAARRIGTAVRGRPIRIVPVPTWVLRAAASGAEVAALARGATSVFNRDKVVDLTQPSWVCDPSQLEAMFGWSAKVGFDEGVARAASDYRLRGLALSWLAELLWPTRLPLDMTEAPAVLVTLGATALLWAQAYPLSVASWEERLRRRRGSVSDGAAVIAARLSWAVLLGGGAVWLSYAAFGHGWHLAVRLPRPMTALAWLVCLGAVTLTITGASATRPKLQALYPEIRAARWSRALAAASLGSWAVYLLGYELLFRGLLTHGLVASLGAWPGLAAMTGLYVLAHLRKGAAETLVCIPMGMLFGAMSLQCDSFVAPWLLHVALASISEVVAARGNPNMDYPL